LPFLILLYPVQYPGRLTCRRNIRGSLASGYQLTLPAGDSSKRLYGGKRCSDVSERVSCAQLPQHVFSDMLLVYSSYVRRIYPMEMSRGCKSGFSFLEHDSKHCFFGYFCSWPSRLAEFLNLRCIWRGRVFPYI
jgi:hypothetical protein